MIQLHLHEAMHGGVVRLDRLLRRHVPGNLLGIGDHGQQVTACEHRIVVVTHADIRRQQEGIGNTLPQRSSATAGTQVNAIVTDDSHPLAIDGSHPYMVNQFIDLGIENKLANQPASVVGESTFLFMVTGKQLVVINVIPVIRRP